MISRLAHQANVTWQCRLGNSCRTNQALRVRLLCGSQHWPNNAVGNSLHCPGTCLAQHCRNLLLKQPAHHAKNTAQPSSLPGSWEGGTVFHRYDMSSMLPGFVEGVWHGI